MEQQEIKVGQIVRYNPKWCSEGERHLLHIVREITLNPVTMQETRAEIETLNGYKFLGHLNAVEVVDFEMIEDTGLTLDDLNLE